MVSPVARRAAGPSAERACYLSAMTLPLRSIATAAIGVSLYAACARDVRAPAPAAAAPVASPAPAPGASLVQWGEFAGRPQPAADARERYGPDSLQVGELRLPAGPGPHPVALVLHGGCWRNQYAVDYVRPLAAALARAGVATWAVEFRRLGDPGGGWPGTFDDVAAAARHLRVLAERHPLDLSRTVYVGHSAGGQLALWLAAERPAGVPAPRGVVSLAGITDLRAYAGPRGCSSAVVPLLGGEPAAVPGRWAAASPVERVPLGVPSRLVQGARDPIVPVAQAHGFAERARAAGDDARVVLLDDAGHFDVVAPWSPAWPAVERTVLELVGPRSAAAGARRTADGRGRLAPRARRL